MTSDLHSNSHHIELGLDRVLALLDRLGNPHLKLPPTIHVAGTNGKGSTIAFLRAIFTQAGLRTHVYTSPHLVRFNERIVLANQEIADDFLQQCLGECKRAAQQNPQIQVTFFEETTAAAFLAFSRVGGDLVLLETGLGGRLDATNVLPQVLASIITPIDFDHTDYLGKTLAKIAYEKAGIIKKGSLVITAKQKKIALDTIAKQANVMKTKLKSFGKDWTIKKQKNNFRFTGFGKDFLLPNPSLIGSHQIENAATAIALILAQTQFSISEDQIKKGITKATGPARLQKISSGKFFKKLPKNCELYLDGSHNLQGSNTVKSFLKQHQDKRIITVFSMLKDKECHKFLQNIATEIDSLVSITIAGESRSHSAQEIQEIANELGINSVAANDLDEAFDYVGKELINDDERYLVLVLGSLYLAGEFL